MDYFNVIVLIIVIFTFATDKKIKSIDQILDKNKHKEKIINIERIKNNLEIVDINYNDTNIDIGKKIKNVEKQYILLKNNNLQLSDENLICLIANYINNDCLTCAFNIRYVYQKDNSKQEKHKFISNIFNNIQITIINFINIFNKYDLASYAAVLLNSSDKEEVMGVDYKNKITSYLSSDITEIKINREQMKNHKFKNIYFNKINKGNFNIILKVLMLILTGSSITINLIYAIINLNIYSIILAFAIYYCYSYVIKYIYYPMGKNRIIANYLFPMYFLVYIFGIIKNIFTKRIKRGHVS